jgi:hypothetical protein
LKNLRIQSNVKVCSIESNNREKLEDGDELFNVQPQAEIVLGQILSLHDAGSRFGPFRCRKSESDNAPSECNNV